MRAEMTEVYREWSVYYTERGDVLIVLLVGGDKSSQAKDIKTAITLAKKL